VTNRSHQYLRSSFPIIMVLGLLLLPAANAQMTATVVSRLTLNPGDDFLTSAVIDSSSGFAYFGTSPYYSGLGPITPSSIVKVSVSNFTRVGAITLPKDDNQGEAGLGAAVIDTTNGYAYFATGSGWFTYVYGPATIVKIRLSDFTRVASLVLDDVHAPILTAVLDNAGGYAYFGTYTDLGRIIRIHLSDFSLDGVLTLEPGEGKLRGGVIDERSGFAYFGTGSTTIPPRIVKVRLSDFTRVGAINFGNSIASSGFSSGMVGIGSGYAYFGTEGSPAILIKIRLSDFTLLGNITLDQDENDAEVAVSDSVYGYVGTASSGAFSVPAKVVAFRLDPFSRVGALTLEHDSALASGVFDMSKGFAYFGSWSSPASIVKVKVIGTTSTTTITESSSTATSQTHTETATKTITSSLTQGAKTTQLSTSTATQTYIETAAVINAATIPLTTTTQVTTTTMTRSELEMPVGEGGLFALCALAVLIVITPRLRLMRRGGRTCRVCGFKNPPYADHFCARCGNSFGVE
jgi:hypothetical protein